MTNKIYTHFKTDDAHWLVPGEVMPKPVKYLYSRTFGYRDNPFYKNQTRDYTNWLTAKEGWIKIHQKVYKVFEGRTGLVEDKDFITCFGFAIPIPQHQEEDCPCEKEGIISVMSCSMPCLQQQEEESDVFVNLLLQKRGEYMHKLERSGNHDYAVQFKAKIEAIDRLLNPDPKIF